MMMMIHQLGRVEEARAWFEEGTRTLEGAASVALWQVGYVMRPGDHQEHELNIRFYFRE